MELDLILRDVASIMDMPFPGQPATSQQWAQPVSPESSAGSNSSGSNSNSSSNYSHTGGNAAAVAAAEEEEDVGDALFPWCDALALGMQDGSGSGEGLQLAVAGRKRRRWDEDDDDDDAHVGAPLHKVAAAAGYDAKVEPLGGETRTKDANKRASAGCGDGRMGGWQVEDLPDNLAADLDGSLSALGVDLTASSYNMSEALLALPSLTVFKQEVPSPSSHDNVPGGGDLDVGLVPKGSSAASQLHQFLHQQQNGALSGSILPTQSQADLDTAVGEKIVSTSATFNQTLSMTVTSVATSTTSPGKSKEIPIDCRFQYVLAAATSIATKVNEATLTYLNQGQSYEIKLKKLGDLSLFRGKILKSVVRICFHERRLQYMEREQMAAWQASRPGDRIIEVDIPLSYGLYDVVQDQSLINTVEILWDPTKEVGVYIKVNCISTEFTPKKHGGEKGVPFRIQVETFFHSEDKISKRLHAAACQIKVFKLKGADRKHKQDREKMLKRPLSDQEKFQPTYDCTVLSDIPVETMFQQSIPAITSSMSANILVNSEPTGNQGRNAALTQTANITASPVATKEEHDVQALPALPAPVAAPGSPDSKLPTAQSNSLPDETLPLSNDATAQQTTQWLQRNRFDQYLRMFLSFSGADILRLSRDDLIQICGLADGIRLYNALHAKGIAPRLTVYLCVERDSVYHALYLASLSCTEMVSKLAHMLGVSPDQIRDIYMQGPGGIHVLITDEVVRNIKDEAMFAIEILQTTQSRERYRLLLKPVQH